MTDASPADPITPLVDLVSRLTFMQMDFTAAVAPSADLVAWSRLGRRYSPDHLTAALAERTLVVLRGRVRPARDMALYLAEMRQGPGPDAPDWQHSVARWVEANGVGRLDILARLSGEGPLLAQEIPDSCVVPWKSSGWTNDRNVHEDAGVPGGARRGRGRRIRGSDPTVGPGLAGISRGGAGPGRAGREDPEDAPSPSAGNRPEADGAVACGAG